jgi:HEPN domain-containing protein
MKPRDAKRKLLGEWLHKADADLDLAEHLLSDNVVYPDAIAFHCQQAAEKYLKAFLVSCGVGFPKTHDLGELLDLIQPVQAALAESLQDVIVLTPYGVDLRYPGDRPEATAQEARDAVALARKVRAAVHDALPPS